MGSPSTGSVSKPGDIGLVGVGVMGANFALNLADHGHRVALFDPRVEHVTQFVAEHPDASFPAGGGLIATRDLKDLAARLAPPRRIMLLVPAGPPTDDVIDKLLPFLEPSDTVIDGGNAHWEDTGRREASLKSKGIRFVGCGVSGGAEGARFGPSLMPGGERSAWEHIRPLWTSIAAKVDPKTGREITGATPGHPVSTPGAEPCTAYVGPAGAGHFVKMVHNGIEYADMQLISEAYQLLRVGLGMSCEQMADVFHEWNGTELDSFLIEITADILRQKDPATGKPFVDVVLDAAGQKGTGKWTSVAALDLGVSAPTIAESVFARAISAARDERVRAAKLISGPHIHFEGDAATRVRQVRAALFCSKVCAYAQGFALIAHASRQWNWDIDLGSLAAIWRGGCIIRARLLEQIRQAFARDRALANLILDPDLGAALAQRQADWREAVAIAVRAGVPAPGFSSALAYFDAYRSDRLPTSLVQAQRDFFGSHTYERVDAPRGKFFHLDWSAKGRPQREV